MNPQQQIIRQLEVTERIKDNLATRPDAYAKVTEVLTWTHLTNSWIGIQKLRELTGMSPKDRIISNLLAGDIGLCEKQTQATLIYQLQTNPSEAKWTSLRPAAAEPMPVKIDTPIDPEPIPIPIAGPGPEPLPVQPLKSTVQTELL